MNCEKHPSPRTLVVLWLVVFSLYSYVHQRHFNNAMAISRLDLLHALVNQGTFSIDAYAANTPDKAVAQGHYYCDKAPGTVFLALPSFYLSSKIMGVFGVTLDSERGWLVTSWAATVCSVGALTALGMVCLFLWLQGFMPSRPALICTLVVAIGSTAFPYATMLLSHGAVIGLLSVALWSLKLGHDQPMAGPNNVSKSGIFRTVLAGAACGLAIACEYDAALVAGGILAIALFQSLKRGGLVILGALPMVSLIPLYNWACLGSPLAMPYQHQAVFTQMHTGFYGIHFPDAGNLIYLLVSPQQGLFFWTPFFLLAFFGYPLLHARSKPLFWICYLVPLVQEIVMSGYYTITAGLTLGTRFFAPLVPLLILPAGLAAVKVPRIGLCLAFGSVLAMGGATVVDASLPANSSDPLLQFYLPELWAGHYTSNLGSVLGLQGHWRLLPLLIAASAGLWFVWRGSRGSNCDEVEQQNSDSLTAKLK